MRFSFSPTGTLVAVAALFAATHLAAKEVVDPVSGETVELADIDFSTLTKSQTKDIASQLDELGFSRSEIRATLQDALADDLTVTDPTTGETVALSDIDFATLSQDEIRALAGELKDQGVSGRVARATIRSEVADDITVTDPVSGETVALSEINPRELTEEQRAALRDELEEAGFSAPDRGGRDGRGKGSGRDGRGSRGGSGDTEETAAASVD